MTDYKTTSLWKNAALQAEEDGVLDNWHNLEKIYDDFWSKGVKLASKIWSDLPDLTLHDEAHLLAVWDTADLIAGPDFPMTPLEVFVFGGAVLLHDLGHTVTAYQGGFEEIRKTDAWREFACRRLDLEEETSVPSDEDLKNLDDDVKKAVLFDTLRYLHADQAEKLRDRHFEGPDVSLNLINDDGIRKSLGQIIGRIAASHHWDRETLNHHLGEKRGGIGSAPKLGTIQPVKLACLLRCADACQIDQRRAPDFDYALHEPNGVSELHWDAQNRLSPPFIDEDKDQNSLVFTASPDFEEDKADAWWVAHDLIQIAHRELQECTALMRDQRLPPFRVSGVAGASDPNSLVH